MKRKSSEPENVNKKVKSSSLISKEDLFEYVKRTPDRVVDETDSTKIVLYYPNVVMKSFSSNVDGAFEKRSNEYMHFVLKACMETIRVLPRDILPLGSLKTTMFKPQYRLNGLQIECVMGYCPLRGLKTEKMISDLVRVIRKANALHVYVFDAKLTNFGVLGNRVVLLDLETCLPRQYSHLGSATYTVLRDNGIFWGEDVPSQSVCEFHTLTAIFMVCVHAAFVLKTDAVDGTDKFTHFMGRHFLANEEYFKQKGGQKVPNKFIQFKELSDRFLDFKLKELTTGAELIKIDKILRNLMEQILHIEAENDIAKQYCMTDLV